MIYPRAFFDLQVRFAAIVAARFGLPLPRALLDYTNLYIRFGLGRSFDPWHPGWREFVDGLDLGDDPGGRAHRLHLARMHESAAGEAIPAFGCFSYAWLPERRIRLHFENRAGGERSPLDAACRGERIAELTTLFGHLRESGVGAASVLGVSWLYNLEGYRRLFPPRYIATARVVRDRFRFMPLWGQFLDREGSVRDHRAARLLTAVEGCASLDDLDDCFPLPVLAVEAPVEVFHEHYGVRLPAGDRVGIR